MDEADRWSQTPKDKTNFYSFITCIHHTWIVRDGICCAINLLKMLGCIDELNSALKDQDVWGQSVELVQATCLRQLIDSCC